MNTTKYHIANRINQELLKYTPYDLKIRIPDSNIDVASIGLNLVKESQNKIRLVQVGACDGSTGDPVNQQLRTGSVDAVVVEPVYENYLALKQSYNGVNNVVAVHAAIGKKDGKANFYKVKNEGRWIDSSYAKQLGSFNVNHLERHGVQCSEIEVIDVTVFTLETLMQNNNISNIDFLLVDTEGYDAEIINMALDIDNPPNILCFEYIHLAKNEISNLFNRFEKMSYKWIHDSMNTLAIRNL